MSAATRAPYRAPRLSFGALLKTFRLRMVGPICRRNQWDATWSEMATLSQTELGLRAGVDKAHVNRLEAGVTRFPSRDVALKLADALELDEIDQARLIIAAGFWPWPESEDTDVELAVRVLLSVVRGDYRRADLP